MARISTGLLTDLRANRLSAETCRAICSGELPILAPERAELLCVLVASGAPSMASLAEDALANIARENFLLGLESEDIAPELIVWCARHLGDQQSIVESLAAHAACPGELLAPLASRLSPPTIHQLFDTLERLASSPALIDALREIAFLTDEERSLLDEMQRVTPAAACQPSADAVIEHSPVSGAPPQLLSLSERLLHMSVLNRIRLAMRGSREERMALIRDSNKVVQRAVLQSPRITPQEIESMAAMTSLASESLRWMGTKRSFLKQYSLVRNLVNNPKTPLDIALHLIPRLNQTDMKTLTKNKNVADTLRSTATRLFTQRSDHH